MLSWNSHIHVSTFDTITPAIPVFKIFLKLCDQISPCQLEAGFMACLASEMADILFRVKESASLAPACPEWTTERLWIHSSELICLCGQILLFQFPFYKRMNVCQTGSFISHGEFTSKPSRFAMFLVSDWEPPGLSVSSDCCCGTRPEQAVGGAHATLPRLQMSVWQKDPSSALMVHLFWCFSSFTDSCWKYTKIEVSVFSYCVSRTHSTQLAWKFLVPFPLGWCHCIPHISFLSRVFPFTQNGSLYWTLSSEKCFSPCFPAPMPTWLPAASQPLPFAQRLASQGWLMSCTLRHPWI